MNFESNIFIYKIHLLFVCIWEITVNAEMKWHEKGKTLNSRQIFFLHAKINHLKETIFIFSRGLIRRKSVFCVCMPNSGPSILLMVILSGWVWISKIVFCLVGFSSCLAKSKTENWSSLFRLWFRISELGKNFPKISTFSADLAAFFNSAYFKFSLFNTSFILWGRFKCSHFLRSWKIVLKISIRQIFERAFSVCQYFLTIPCFRPSLRTSFNPRQLWATLLSDDVNSRRCSNAKFELSEWRIGTGWTSEPGMKRTSCTQSYYHLIFKLWSKLGVEIWQAKFLNLRLGQASEGTLIIAINRYLGYFEIICCLTLNISVSWIF